MLGIYAAHVWQYALAPLLFAGGLMFAFESAQILIGRAKHARRPDANQM